MYLENQGALHPRPLTAWECALWEAREGKRIWVLCTSTGLWLLEAKRPSLPFSGLEADSLTHSLSAPFPPQTPVLGVSPSGPQSGYCPWFRALVGGGRGSEREEGWVAALLLSGISRESAGGGEMPSS